MIIKKAIFKCDGTQEFTDIEVPDDYFLGDEASEGENTLEFDIK